VDGFDGLQSTNSLKVAKNPLLTRVISTESYGVHDKGWDVSQARVAHTSDSNEDNILNMVIFWYGDIIIGCSLYSGENRITARDLRDIKRC
jgi:hypothetical protein